jgi:hypothetical protein
MVRCPALTSLIRCLALLFGTAALLVATKARAWGDDGHRVVGELAFRQLSPEAQAAVAECLEEPGYRTLAEAATWPDTYARRFPEYDAMKPFHYVNVDHRAASYSQKRDCPVGCVVTALAQFVALLESRDPPLSLSERRRAVYWISHLVGDIHQPLHVAHPDGKGGTATYLRFFDEPDKRHAHWIWDFGLIERRPPPAPSLQAGIATDQPLYRSLADELGVLITAQKRRAWARVTAAEALANEGLLLSRRHAYLLSSDHVNAAYEDSRWPIVEQQLAKAGVRLAAILERALARSVSTSTSTPGSVGLAAPP